jgi:hypothetical protein
MSTAVGKTIDGVMEQCSQALADADYFGAEQLALKGLKKAYAVRDWERMARICLPLQEARRQKRHEALDSGVVRVVRALPSGKELVAGCYLLEPPLIGAEARGVRALAEKKKIPVMVLTREPTTSKGLWPIVAAGEDFSIRVQVTPPGGDPGPVVGFRNVSPPTVPPPGSWMILAEEKLGDAAIAKLRAGDPPAHRAADLLEFLEVIPEHEKLHQRLADECRLAAGAPEPTRPRRRAVVVESTAF